MPANYVFKFLIDLMEPQGEDMRCRTAPASYFFL